MNLARKILPTVLFMGLVFTACRKENVDQPYVQGESSSPFVEGEITVRFSEEVANMLEEDLPGGLTSSRSAELKAALDELGVTAIRRRFPDGGEFEARRREYGLHTFYTLSYDPVATKSVSARDFASIPGAVNAEKVRKQITTTVFNDPYYIRQWHCFNDGSLASNFVYGADINVEPVWEHFTKGSRDVMVAVVDGGIDQDHEDLAFNYAGGLNFCEEGSLRGRIVPHRHGTHVAGILGAVNNNGKGISGIAGGDRAMGIGGVRLLSCQIFAPNPQNPSSDIRGDGAEALLFACEMGAVIAQCSWNLDYDTEAEAAAGEMSEALKYAIDYFIGEAGYTRNGRTKIQTGPMGGGVVFFSAGNKGWKHNPIGEYKPIPAPDPENPDREMFSPLVSVGAISPDLQRAPYSNYGDWVDICAPGGNSNITYGQIYSTVPNGSYGYMQGTSMACPMVSGVAALIVSYFGGTGFTNQDLLEKLYRGANRKVAENQEIGPLVDAFGSFTYGDTTPPDKVTRLSVDAVANNIVVNFTVAADEGSFKANRYKILVSKAKELLTDELDFDNLPTGIISAEVNAGRANVGDEISYVVNNLEFDRMYYVAVVGYDYQGNHSPISGAVSATTLSGDNPVSLYPNPVSDRLYVSTVNEGESSIIVRSGTGEMVYKATIPTSPFQQAYINFSHWAIGRYTVEVTYKDVTYTKNIIKL